MGVANAPAELAVEAINITTDTSRYNRYLDRKHYELGNHLGNCHSCWLLPKSLTDMHPGKCNRHLSGVLATVSGHKVMMQETVGQWAFGFEPGEDNIFDDDRHEQLLSTTQAHTGTYSIYQDYNAGGEWGPRVNIHVHAGDVITLTIYGLTENTDITKSGAIVKTLTDASGTLLYLDQNGQSPVWVADGWFDNVNWTQRGFSNYTIPNNLYYANGTSADMEEIYLFAYTVVPSGEGPTYFDDISITIQWADPVNHYQADVVSYSDYYPFGMQMPGRNGSTGAYRYGFNGKEMDSEVSGSGNQYDYGFRIYNPRLGKFLSVDPLFKEFPWYTPYQFAGNNPIWALDLDGLEDLIYTESIRASHTGRILIDLSNHLDSYNNFIETLGQTNTDVYVLSFRSMRGSSHPNEGPYRAAHLDKEGYLTGYKGYTSSNAINSKEDFDKLPYPWPGNINYSDIEESIAKGRSVVLVAVDQSAAEYLDTKLAAEQMLGDLGFSDAKETEDNDEYVKNALVSTLETFIHELEAHAKNLALGVEKTNEQEHAEYNGEGSMYSPTVKELLGYPKFKDTPASKNAAEILKVVTEYLE